MKHIIILRTHRKILLGWRDEEG